MRKAFLAGASVLAVLAAVAFPPASLAASDRSVVVEDSFDDEACGIAGTATIRFTDVFRETETTFEATGTFRYTFTADETGKSFTVLAAGPSLHSLTIDEDAGTVTFVDTFIGLPEKISGSTGPLLTLDAGTVTITTTFSLDQFDPETGETVGDPLSVEVSFLHGPHPELESDFNLFCEVVEPYLLDP
jgi:hypothetical protein